MPIPKYAVNRDLTDQHLQIAQDAAGRIITANYLYSHITADTQIKGAPGTLHTLTVNSCTGAGVLTLYDDLAEVGTIIAAIAIPITPVPVTLHYDVDFVTALYTGYDGALAADITISYR